MQIEIEVVSGDSHSQRLQRFTVTAGLTARQAVALAEPEWPAARQNSTPIGVFGKKVRDDYVLRPYDRVEIYRPLLIDPKEARRLRAANKTAEKADSRKKI